MAYTAKSVAELLEAVRLIRVQWGTNVAATEELWFRGDDKREYPGGNLLPGLYRQSVAKYGYDEFTLFERFKSSSAPFVRTKPESDWHWYFLAQHYGLPTRLLDWTESLLAALYFALEPYARGWDKPTHDAAVRAAPTATDYGAESPTVWVLEAGTLNAFSIKDDCVVLPGGPTLDKYLPRTIGALDPANEYPVAVLPPRATDRIVAQQGLFTIHGRVPTGLDGLAAGAGSGVRLEAILLDRNSVPRLWEELQLTGVNRLTMFPELQSVAPHVCWLHQMSPPALPGSP